ncbi:MAG: hypothetical protein UY21_C0015G0003 [Microgenomates group bacterium GW2011_GWA1_48_10]|uniref:Antitoxin n=1 Tax=Candidatus Gottesmanbacteria bacterium RIFCSPHIGHO2_01_FULL_47_48 TaxID=1798381 RepID=A0A1F6A513_9BACT|nr:MAG: hypothetical protein UY21_C0015G0003 [Microgenomates group bacterium GW2011_GWA1_48_10]OGG19781.1 MAG: hypothetical protein A2721_01250 [Candidatus Gottesmanbacteria bacterium RIFCSPHIGHO2_01_FULL_47_48]
MTWTVSISDLRNNLSDYIDKVKAGDDLVVKDEKKDEEVAVVRAAKKKFNPVAYRAMLDRVSGTISAKNHPEWATIAKTEKWLRKIRKASDRRIHVPS